MTDDTIFHTIRDCLPSRMLLAKQWVERINIEHELLTVRIKRAKDDEQALTRAEADYLTWHKRLQQDVALIESRLREDGFEPSVIQLWEHNTLTQIRVPILDQNIPAFLVDGTDFTPDISNGVENVTHVWVWRKAVQS